MGHRKTRRRRLPGCTCTFAALLPLAASHKGKEREERALIAHYEYVNGSWAVTPDWKLSGVSGSSLEDDDPAYNVDASNTGIQADFYSATPTARSTKTLSVVKPVGTASQIRMEDIMSSVPTGWITKQHTTHYYAVPVIVVCSVLSAAMIAAIIIILSSVRRRNRKRALKYADPAKAEDAGGGEKHTPEKPPKRRFKRLYPRLPTRKQRQKHRAETASIQPAPSRPQSPSPSPTRPPSPLPIQPRPPEQEQEEATSTALEAPRYPSPSNSRRSSLTHRSSLSSLRPRRGFLRMSASSISLGIAPPAYAPSPSEASSSLRIEKQPPPESSVLRRLSAPSVLPNESDITRAARIQAATAHVATDDKSRLRQMADSASAPASEDIAVHSASAPSESDLTTPLPEQPSLPPDSAIPQPPKAVVSRYIIPSLDIPSAPLDSPDQQDIELPSAPPLDLDSDSDGEDARQESRRREHAVV